MGTPASIRGRMMSKTVVLKNSAHAGTPMICAPPMRPMRVMVPGSAGTP